MKFYTEDITDKQGQPLTIVWEYDETRRQIADPDSVFSQRILPAMREKRCWYYGEKLLGFLGHIELIYNFRRLCFLTFGDPLESASAWAGHSFPDFVRYHLSAWAGKKIEAYRDYPRRPFRFACFAYNSGPYRYYLPADTEAALTRDFKRFPATKEETAVWQYIRKTRSIARADLTKKTEFLAAYAGLINSCTPVKIDKFSHLTL